MTLEERILRHPSRRQLMAHTEALIDGSAPVNAALAKHLAECDACHDEADGIRRSLKFVASAPALDPSSDLAAQILMNAAKTRRRTQRRNEKRSTIVGTLSGLACAAAIALIASVVFSAALSETTPPDTVNAAVVPERHATESQPSPEQMQRTFAHVKALSAAVRFSPAQNAQSPRDLERRRAVSAMDADIAAAMSALERNPGCIRATHIVNANLKRQAETLRTLYVERTL